MRGRASSADGLFVRLAARLGACAMLCFLLAHCADSGRVDPRYGVSASARVVESGQPVPKGGGVYRVGSPYMVGGRMYVPQDDPHYRADGLASWYGQDFHGRSTANGEIFDLNSMTAAHPTMPLPSYARVTNLSNGRSVIVRVNDRGPYHGNRIIDVSGRAAHLLDFRAKGTAWVRVEYVGRAPIEGSDDRLLEATLRHDEAAPAPGSLKLAATPLVPAVYLHDRGTRVASASSTGSLQALSYAGDGAGGTDKFLLNGRGLY
jgi:rare lipoprotein A